MKIFVILALPAAVLASFRGGSLLQATQLEAGTTSVSTDDANGCPGHNGCAHCVSHAEGFMTKPMTKYRAIEGAMDNCALSKKVEDNNFVCPHYREVLNQAFAREPTDRLFSAKTFCKVAEVYVSQLREAAKIPHMGTGAGFKFKLSKDCKPIVMASLAPEKTLPSRNAPDFWYALCMNQDCAHFLPSRTRWCSESHQPTHSAAVCEAVRRFAHDEITIFSKQELDAGEVCDMYDEFVEASHIDVDAYMHVVHGKEHHAVPVPANPSRALDSAKMKHEAKKHGMRDATGVAVKSAAARKWNTSLVFALMSVVGLCA